MDRKNSRHFRPAPCAARHRCSQRGNARQCAAWTCQSGWLADASGICSRQGLGTACWRKLGGTWLVSPPGNSKKWRNRVAKATHLTIQCIALSLKRDRIRAYLTYDLRPRWCVLAAVGGAHTSSMGEAQALRGPYACTLQDYGPSAWYGICSEHCAKAHTRGKFARNPTRCTGNRSDMLSARGRA